MADNSTVSASFGALQPVIEIVKRSHPAKLLLLAFLLAYYKSWPFFWHFRVFRPVVRVTLRDIWHNIRVKLAMTKHRKIELEEQWLDTIPNVGQNPFEFKNVYRTTATLDECDWNMHLSNSSYAKILDSSRFETAVQLWPLFFRSGGTLALGATHFQFIREIPPLTNFEIRTYVGTWDKKWLYLVSKYVSKPKRRVPDKAKPLSPPDSTTGTPPPTRSILTESDGAIVHTIAIAHLCFKANRITVPPAFVLATNGFSTFPYTSPTPYSARNPPPHWQKVKNIASLKHGGSMRKFFKFMREGWKEVPEKERWWETALGGEVETRRVLALAELEPLQKGLDAALHVG